MAPAEDAGFQGAAPRPPEAGDAGLIPWENPDLPRLPALWRTLRELLLDPQAFFQRLGRNGWGEALAFGLITGTIGLLACYFWSTLFYAAVSQSAGESWGVPQLYTAGTGLAVLLMVASPAFALFNLAFGAFCLWVALALAGASRDFNPPWRIYSYAQGAMVAGIIPFLGVPLAGLLVLALIYVGVQAAFQTSGWRTLGVMLLFLFCNICLIALLAGALLALLAFLGFLVFLS